MSNSLDLDQVHQSAGLIWVQTVCIGYRQMILEANHWTGPLLFFFLLISFVNNKYNYLEGPETFVGNVNAYGSFPRFARNIMFMVFIGYDVSEHCQVKRYLIPKKFAKGVLHFLICFYEDETY